jgi:uncharacterized protein
MSVRVATTRLPARLLLAFLVAGCAGSPPTNLYTLSPVDAPATEIRPRSTSAIVAVGPVTLPDYIDRPQIVTRRSAYQLEIAAYDQWAAPLYDMLPRVLVDDVASRLPSDRVVAFPQVGDASFDYRIAVDVGRFDVDETGEATLAARWQLYVRSSSRALIVAEETLRRRIDGRGYDAHAASLSAVLADLGDRIARDVNSARASAAPLAACCRASDQVIGIMN